MQETGYYEEARRVYSIKQYREDIYQVTRFKVSDYFGIPMVKLKEESKSYDEKLANSFSRARSMVKQLGLCNPWSWFITLTLDKEKYDRFNLDVFKKDLQQFIRDMRKKYLKLYPDTYTERLSVLLVPENHKDGAWHIHGLVNGIPPQALEDFIPGKHPRFLIQKGFKNWPDYAKKFGFCSLGGVRDQYTTVLYILKYINKNIEALSTMKGKHLYMASRPLATAETVLDVYYHDMSLDSYLEYHGEFCSVGMVKGVDWTFPLTYDRDIPKWYISGDNVEEPPIAEKLPYNLPDDFDVTLIDPDAQCKLWNIEQKTPTQKRLARRKKEDTRV